jgi:hypothetical protein
MNKARLERLGLWPQSIEMTDAADDWLNGSDGEKKNCRDCDPCCRFCGY